MGVEWMKEPPPDKVGTSLPIVRTPTYKPLAGVVLSAGVIGTITHFYKGRTQPCSAPDCEPCRNGMPWRWHGYVAAWQKSLHQIFIFEFTSQAADAFISYEKSNGTLRGCQFRSYRPSRTVNGRIVIETRPADLQNVRLPEAPDLIRCLCCLWNLGTTQVTAEQAKDRYSRLHAKDPDGGNGENPRPLFPNPQDAS